jgi:hypothetical protein
MKLNCGTQLWEEQQAHVPRHLFDVVVEDRSVSHRM